MRQVSNVSLPFPSTWQIDAWVGGRPNIHGTLIINSVRNNRVSGTINFRGSHIPINGYWNEQTKQISFNSPYASYEGNFTTFTEPLFLHFILRGRLRMNPPSIHAGENGTWVATNDVLINASASSRR